MESLLLLVVLTFNQRDLRQRCPNNLIAAELDKLLDEMGVY
jgi:hypothetical protein